MSTIRVKVVGPDAITLFKGMAKYAGTRVRESDYVGFEAVRVRAVKPASGSAGAAPSPTGPTQPYCYLVVNLDTFVSHLAKLSEK